MGGNQHSRLSIQGLAVLSILGALLFAAKMALAAIPNIEPVSLLVMVYSVVFGRRALYPIYLYVTLECLMWGLGPWSLAYLYVWPLLGGLAWLLRRMESPLGWAVLSGAFGLSFGALSAIVYWIAGGWAAAVSWWIAGIPFDALHCAGNFTIALVLFNPCRKALSTLAARTGLSG